MRYRVEQSKGNSISPRAQLILYVFLNFLTNISYQCNNNFMKRAVQTCSIRLFHIMQNTVVENSMLSIAPFSYLEFEVQKYKESIRKLNKKRTAEEERCFNCTFEGLELN